jgi:hypothetical protein
MISAVDQIVGRRPIRLRFDVDILEYPFVVG